LITTATDNYRVFAQEDKTQECKSKQSDMFSKMKQWLSKRQTPIGQLDQDGSLKANLISLSKEMTQITQDCRGVIDLSNLMLDTLNKIWINSTPCLPNLTCDRSVVYLRILK
jgi:hypothetical protein